MNIFIVVSIIIIIIELEVINYNIIGGNKKWVLVLLLLH